MKTFLSALLLTVMCHLALAQDDTQYDDDEDIERDTAVGDPTWIIKTNVPAQLLNGANLSLERGYPGVSWMLTVGWTVVPYVPLQDRRQAVRLVLDRRYYLFDTVQANTGWYVSPYIRASAVSREATYDRLATATGYNESYTSNSRFLKVGFGLAVGKQYLFDNGIALDVFGGVGLNPAMIVVGKGSAPERGELRSEILDFRLGVLLGGVLR